jgi:hypothetical protein
VSLTISHRSLQHSWRSSLATVCLNTIMLLGTKVTTNSEPSGTMDTWRRGGSTFNPDNSSSSNADIHATSTETKRQPNDLFDSRSAETGFSINGEIVTFTGAPFRFHPNTGLEFESFTKSIKLNIALALTRAACERFRSINARPMCERRQSPHVPSRQLTPETVPPSVSGAPFTERIAVRRAANRRLLSLHDQHQKPEQTAADCCIPEFAMVLAETMSLRTNLCSPIEAFQRDVGVWAVTAVKLRNASATNRRSKSPFIFRSRFYPA